MESNEQRTKKIVGELLGVDQESIKPESSLIDDLGADSLDTVELLVSAEEEFGIEISDDEAGKISTFNDCLSLINQKTQKQAA